MKITAQRVVENFVFKNMAKDLPSLKDHIKTELSIDIGKVLVTFPELFTETLSEQPFDNTRYELQAIVISMQTFRKIGEILRSKLNDTELDKLHTLFIEKL